MLNKRKLSFDVTIISDTCMETNGSRLIRRISLVASVNVAFCPVMNPIKQNIAEDLAGSTCFFSVEATVEVNRCDKSNETH